jgi:hypothetical protein
MPTEFCDINKKSWFVSLIQKNHLFAAQGAGAFNPGLLLLDTAHGKALKNRVVYNHELSHAKLSVSIIGRIIFIIQVIALDALTCWSHNGDKAEFATYWDFYLYLNEVNNELLSHWLVTHEGYATWNDIKLLKKMQDDRSKRMLDSLYDLISRFPSSPYAKGFLLANQIERAGMPPTAIIHQLGNVNPFASSGAIFCAANVKKNMAACSPDSLLKRFVQNIAVVSGSSDVTTINPESARDVIASVLKDIVFIRYERYVEKNSLLDEVITDMLTHAPVPANYATRLTGLRDVYNDMTSGTIHKKYPGLVTSRLLFEASIKKSKQDLPIYKLKNWKQGVSVDVEQQSNTLALYNEIETLTLMNNTCNKYLPNNSDQFKNVVSKTIPLRHCYFLFIAVLPINNLDSHV